MRGKIVRGVGGFYYVHTESGGLYECRAKGIFRSQKIKPMVGDDVEIEVLQEEAAVGNLTAVLQRKNELLRPAVANVDQAMVIFAVQSPNPNFHLLDRFLLMMEQRQIPVGICFTKTDLAGTEVYGKWGQEYRIAGYEVFFISTQTGEGVEELWHFLHGKTTALAGPSGVGKSSLLNFLSAEQKMQTGAVSEKIGRGRHTTRHAELFLLDDDTYLYDTPGFSSLELPQIEGKELRFLFPEFTFYEGKCRFQGCLHIHEPDCKVKEAVQNGSVGADRYQNYVMFYNEITNRRKY